MNKRPFSVSSLFSVEILIGSCLLLTASQSWAAVPTPGAPQPNTSYSYSNSLSGPPSLQLSKKTDWASATMKPPTNTATTLPNDDTPVVKSGILGTPTLPKAVSQPPLAAKQPVMPESAKQPVLSGVTKQPSVSSSTTIYTRSNKPALENAEIATKPGNVKLNSKKNPAKPAVATKPGKAIPAKTPLKVAAPEPVFVPKIDILRAVPLDVTGYDAGKAMPPHFVSSGEVIAAIDATPVLLVHMEAFRRSFHDLSKEEQRKVLAELQRRRKLNETDLKIGFDYGYAQLVYDNNKTGLFFLRKANDRFQSQFSALAYGMAQVEADLNLENSTPEEMTTRKLDAMFQLGDAVRRDATDHQPGFWPSFLQVLELMKPLTAYGSFPKRDFSLVYVPHEAKGGALGSILQKAEAAIPAPPPTALPETKPDMSASSTTSASKPVATPTDTDPSPGALLSTTLNASCTPVSDDKDLNSNAPVTGGRTAIFNRTSVTLQSSPTEVAEQNRIRVLSASGRPMLSFRTFAPLSSLVEDIDGDGTPEIVARQFAKNPKQPVTVYRYTPCGFELDHKIFNYFQ